MRITCPSCAAEYDVPGTLAPGRAVKCAKCGSKWAPIAPLLPPVEVRAEPVAPIPPPPTPLPTPPAWPERLAVPVANAAPRRLPLMLAWLGSILVLAGLVAAAIIWREPVMATWPPSVRLYAALGLTAHP